MPHALRCHNLREAFLYLMCAACALFAALYLELFLEQAYPDTLTLVQAITAYPVSVPVARFLILFIGSVIIGSFVVKSERILHFVFTYRFPLAGTLLALLVLFQINGSSISLWTSTLGSSTTDTGLLFGIPRTIRSDEWLVLTPFAISQDNLNYPALSSLLCGGATDVTMVYALPAWALATAFRPFLWGYLLFGSSYGLSFFWCGRLIALFLATFELARLYTDDDRRLGAAMAILVTLAPITQWWFAVNGTAEILIFGQLMVILLHRFLSGVRPLVAAALLPWVGGCYLLVIYPSWQVPFFFVFAAMGVWVFLAWRKSGKRLNRKAIAVLAMATVIAITLIILALYQSKGAIAAVMSSVYPGSRNEHGGGLAGQYFDYGTSILSALNAEGVLPNACEHARFFSLAPCGLLVSAYALARKKRDVLLGALLVVQLVFLVYGFIGLPEAICKLLLLNNVQTNRLTMAIGFIDLVMLLRSVCILRKLPEKRHTGFVAILGLGLVVGLVGSLIYPNASLSIKETALLVLAFAIFAIALCTLCTASQTTKRASAFFLIAALSTVGVSGLCVNPIQQGTDFLEDIPALCAVQEISQDSPESLWIGDTNIEGQACILAGASCLNSINTYPHLQTWAKIDPTGYYAEIYNRYAHIDFEIQDEEATYFELIQADRFKIHLNADDLEKLDVSFILSQEDYTDIENLVPVSTCGNYTIYRVD